MTKAEKKLIMNRIHPVDRLQDLSGSELVIETISEDIDSKRAVFDQLDRLCGPEVILASNTSTLSLTELAGVTAYPERVIGMHFVYPASQADLVEIVRGLKTSDRAGGPGWSAGRCGATGYGDGHGSPAAGRWRSDG